MGLSEKWTIGSLIKKIREDQGMAQYLLCSGLCSPATMTRIEADDRDMDMIMAIRIFQRIGFNPDKFELYGSSDEFDQYEQRNIIEKWMRTGDCHNVKRELLQYEEMWKFYIDTDRLQYQFVMGIRGYLAMREGRMKEGQALLKAAIETTVPNFNETWHKTIIVGEYELGLINLLADANELSGEKQNALSLRMEILEYIDHREIKKDQMVDLYTEVVCKISNLLVDMGKLKSCLELCDRGLEILSLTRRLYHWPDLLYWRAKCLEGLTQNGMVDRQFVIDAYRRAYYIYDLFENAQMSKKVWSHLMEVYQWQCIR